MIILDKILEEKKMKVIDLERLMSERGTKLSRLSISKIINKVASPKASTLQDIANALDIDIKDLFESTKSKDESAEEIIKDIEDKINKLKQKL